jgi:hypothetical protein
VQQSMLLRYTKKDVRSNEATMKYLLMNEVRPSILVHGFSWLYGSLGEEIVFQEIMNSFINTQMYLLGNCMEYECKIGITYLKITATPWLLGEKNKFLLSITKSINFILLFKTLNLFSRVNSRIVVLS